MPLSPAQTQVANSPNRFKVVIAGRRFGKTHLSIRELCRNAREPNMEVWYVAPTYKMARQIVWRKLKNKLQDLNWIAKTNETELSIALINGSLISLKGADNYDSLRGVGLDFIVLDEFADIDPDAWYETLRPTLSDRQGKALFIGTPKGIGNWAYEIYQNSQDDPSNWASFSYTTLDGGNVSEDEIEQARKDLDERTFRQEYMATFETFSGRIYYAFDRAANVRKYEGNTPDVLYVGMDFNIDPMSAVIATRIGDTLHIIDEVRIFSSNTIEMIDELKQRFSKSKIWVYPDPAGNQRKTSAGGATDVNLLSNAGFIVKSPRTHTPVRDRINAVNSRLCSSSGIRHLIIDPKCKYTIEGLERQIYKEGSSQPDKDSGYDHMNDALGYMIDYIFPVIRNVDPTLLMPQRWGHRVV
ncbi:phage_term_2, phage terminase, large subunit, PBSX family [uncultured Caudovirales phage]|uniref:Phage_term_2, phage terminase, large subunit, PBSX family n=1 Tax=uncultured Caudovirales phage TaxID=2100421 RepID=A0A6J5SXQ7_9CAUD|nr:phage_term_2, phage terminase, large subunit, PBSX family [uncultured Caudovirales phage]CAB4220372.1 phage_term_2, phage terminase, large subunit, PBSX family [uncultured Caudovirales phage]